METIVEEKVYEFRELDKEIQEELIEKHRYDEVESYNWYECITENWNQELERLGYLNPAIMFSGFYSQGDGACFTASVDLEVYLPRHRMKTKFKSLINEDSELTIGITHSWRYYYPTSTDVNVDFQYHRENRFKEAILNVLVDELEKKINDERETLGNEIYKELQQWYEDLTTDEMVKERLNELNFNEYGEEICQTT